MKEYYAIIRSTDHLAHYGVKGMKWGVRKALARGNEKALDRHFRKAAKKLAKLQDIGLHSGKYAAKAAAYGAAAAGTGTMAIAGTGALKRRSDSLRANLQKQYDTINASYKATKYKPSKQKYITQMGAIAHQIRKLNNDKLTKAGEALAEWGQKTHTIGKVEVPTYKEAYRKYNLGGPKIYEDVTISNDTLARIGTGALALGLGAKAAQNLYRSANSKKYIDKANKWKNEMDNTFIGTKYEGQYVTPPKYKKKKRR